jgi:hypothetical protein
MKFALALVTAGFLAGSTAMAMPQLFKQSAAPNTVAPKKSENCADFTGKWTGRCEVSDGFVYDNTVEIEFRDCRELIIGGAYRLQVGGRRSETQANSGDTYTSITDLDWASPEKTTLRFKGTLDSRSLTGTSKVSGLLRAELKFVDSRLQLTESWSTFEPRQSQQYTECLYTKAP